MSVHTRRASQERTGGDRSHEAAAFIDAVTEVCRRHGYAIGHQHAHGDFEVVRYTVAAALEPNLEWFTKATEVIWLSLPAEMPKPEPEPPKHEDPFT